MMRLSSVRKALRVSILKTVRFNWHYFGFRSIFRPRVAVSRNVVLSKLKGQVIVDNSRTMGVRLGFWEVSIKDRRERFIWENEGTVIFNGSATVGFASKISCRGVLRFGEGVIVSASTSFVCNKEIRVGDRSQISWDCLIMDTDLHEIYSMEDHRRLNEDRAVVIGDHVLVGCRSTVMKGTEIGDECVVAAGSVMRGRWKTNNAILSTDGVVRENIKWGKPSTEESARNIS